MIDFNGFIQIAGIIDKEEAELVIASGAEFLGFPLRLPVHKEDLTEEYTAEIISGFPEGVHGILITYLDKAEEIFDLMRKLNCEIVQLHGSIAKAEIVKLKELLPEAAVIKSLVVSENNFDELRDTVELLSGVCSAFITDTFDPATGASGATGKTHDWKISRELVKLSPIPVILAGGLNPSNVKEAIMSVKPAGVDVHTGVENSNGRKSAQKLEKFIRKAKEAFELAGAK